MSWNIPTKCIVVCDGGHWTCLHHSQFTYICSIRQMLGISDEGSMTTSTNTTKAKIMNMNDALNSIHPFIAHGSAPLWRACSKGLTLHRFASSKVELCPVVQLSLNIVCWMIRGLEWYLSIDLLSYASCRKCHVPSSIYENWMLSNSAATFSRIPSCITASYSHEYKIFGTAMER